MQRARGVRNVRVGDQHTREPGCCELRDAVAHGPIQPRPVHTNDRRAGISRPLGHTVVVADHVRIEAATRIDDRPGQPLGEVLTGVVIECGSQTGLPGGERFDGDERSERPLLGHAARIRPPRWRPA